MVLGRMLITVGSVALIAGCAATKQASKVQGSGFLGSDTYALLQSGREGRAVLSYVNEDANIAKYDNIILEPVTIWGDPEDPALQPEDRTMLANVTYTAFHEALAKDYEIVEEPGPTTMVVAIALTKAEAGDAALNTVSSIVPQARLLRGAASFFMEKPAFVGEAQGEAKVTDSMTGELLGAAVDRQFGSQAPRVTTDSWDDVVAIIDYWSEWSRFRFCQERGDNDCVAPEA
jgi:hypothetical protein